MTGDWKRECWLIQSICKEYIEKNGIDLEGIEWDMVIVDITEVACVLGRIHS